MSIAGEVERARDALIAEVNSVFDRLLARLETPIAATVEPAIAKGQERLIPLAASTALFYRQKPVAVMFGNERVAVSNWPKAFAAILSRCNQEPACHERLMYMRERVAGKTRVYLSAKPDGMRCPVRIDDELYSDTQYVSETLMRILVARLLTPAGFDCSEVGIVVKA